MLVLTRRTKDKISFPQLGVSIHFIRVQSGQVKVGVDAPQDVKILRDEIQDEEATAKLLERQISRLPKNIRHGIRNELHQVSVGMHLYKELVAASLMSEASEVFEQIQESLTRLDQAEALNPASKPDEDIESPAKKPSPAPASPREMECGTVVLVEDQSNEREMLASVLRLQNLSVVTCANGNEAIDYFHDHPAPNYLLMDMNMPECDGAAALHRLRDEGQLDSTQVYAVSGISPESYGVTVGQDDSDVSRWFPKPLNPSVLIEAMH